MWSRLCIAGFPEQTVKKMENWKRLNSRISKTKSSPSWLHILCGHRHISQYLKKIVSAMLNVHSLVKTVYHCMYSGRAINSLFLQSQAHSVLENTCTSVCCVLGT